MKSTFALFLAGLTFALSSSPFVKADQTSPYISIAFRPSNSQNITQRALPEFLMVRLGDFTLLPSPNVTSSLYSTFEGLPNCTFYSRNQFDTNTLQTIDTSPVPRVNETHGWDLMTASVPFPQRIAMVHCSGNTGLQQTSSKFNIVLNSNTHIGGGLYRVDIIADGNATLVPGGLDVLTIGGVTKTGFDVKCSFNGNNTGWEQSDTVVTMKGNKAVRLDNITCVA